MAEYQYNLADFGGYWHKLETGGTHVTTDFEVGAFPFEIAYVNIDSICAHYGPTIYLDTAKLCEDAKAGDKITIAYKLPSVKWPTYGTLESQKITLELKNSGGDKRILCTYNYFGSTVTLKTSHDGIVSSLSWTELLSDAIATKDSTTGGFILSGTLVDNITTISIAVEWQTADYIYAGELGVTHDSYDDMQIAVTSAQAVVPTIDRKAMTLGWLMGRAVAAQRGQRANPRI